MEILIKLLGACEDLLRSVGETFWFNKIQGILKRSAGKLDDDLLEEILSWYGGMGSFNDLIISEYNGHSTKGKDEVKLNNELRLLRSRIYDEVLHLKKKQK